MKLLKEQFPELRDEYAAQFAELFQEIRRKCESSEISTKPLDLRGLTAAINLIKNGLSAGQAFNMGIVNKSFDEYEKQLISDILKAGISLNLNSDEIFE